MNVMLRPGSGVWVRMVVVVSLAYGGSFVVRSVTSVLTGIVSLAHQEAVAIAVR